MTKLKRILSAVIAVALAVSLLVPMTVSAAVPADKLNKMGFVAYHVLDRDPKTIPADDEEDDNNKVYTVNEDFADFFKNITPTNYNAGIHNNTIWLTLDENNSLKIVPADDPRPADVIVLSVNNDVTANSGDVLAGVLLSGIKSNKATASDAQRLAGWLKKYAEAKDITPVPVTATEDGKVDVGDLEYGYWLVYSTKDINGVSSVKVVLEVGEGEQSTINVKAEYDGLDKKVKNDTDNGALGDTAQADSGDILEYEVKFNIQALGDYPANNGYDINDLEYIITDTLTNQRLVKYTDPSTYIHGENVYFMGAFLLEFNINGTKTYYTDVKSNEINDALKTSLGLNVTDTLEALVGIRKDGGISYGEYAGGTQQFSIEFLWNTLRDKLSTHGAAVTLKYKAELTSDAVLANPNKVELKYSNDPSDHTKKTTNEDTTTVYSFGLDVTKTFGGEKGTEDLWKDVTFNLYEATMLATHAEDEDDKQRDVTVPLNNLVESYRIAFVGSNGNYHRADSTDTANQSYDIKLSDTDNTFNLYGLDPGYYILEETSSPNGYLLGGKVYILIGESGNVLSISNSAVQLGEKTAVSFTTETNSDKNSLKFTIDNKKRDFELPETGSIGVWLFGIGGVLLIAIAVFVYRTLKKREQSK